MFWGLILEPSRRYTQTVSKPFHISMASMDETTSDDGPTQVILTFQERNYLLCTLKKGEIVNVPLDLNFGMNDQISFASNGNSHVHLTGYLIEEEDPFDSDSEEEEEVETEVPVKTKRKLQQNGEPPKKKSKTLELLENVASDDESDDETVHLSDLSGIDTTVDDDDDTSDDDDDEAGEEEEDEDEEGLEEEEDEELEEEEDDDEEEEIEPKKAKQNGKAAKKEQKQEVKPSKKEKQQKGAEKSPQKQQQSPKKEAASPKKDQTASPAKKTLENGVVIEDLKVGQGPAAKFGKVVQVYYEGRLKSNNKVFDSSKKGPGFEFRLGRKEVIKGWDVGVQGMKVGGKRRIICPPNMAYGTKGSPPVIPPNSTLVFEVELKKVL